jgi:hypothetical protein
MYYLAFARRRSGVRIPSGPLHFCLYLQVKRERARGPDLTSALSDSYPLYPRASTSPQRPGLPSSPQELASGKVAELAEAVLGLKERINTLDEELEKRFSRVRRLGSLLAYWA